MKQLCSANSINYLFIQVAKAHRTRTGELLSTVGLHVGQEMILVALSQHQNLSLSKLADILEVQPPTVTKMVQRLEMLGVVQREVCQRDNRVSYIYLTSKGELLQVAMEKLWLQIEKEFLADMTETEKLSFQTLLGKARDNLSKTP